MSSSAIAETIDCIYDAALEPARWPEALKRTADACNAVGAVIAHDDFARPERAFLWLGRLAPELYENYVDDYMPSNPWAIGATIIKPGAAVCFDTVVSAAKLKRSPFYTDILRPQGILHCIGETTLRTTSGALAAAVVRSPRVGPASDEDLARFAQLSGHLGRAARLSMRLADTMVQKDSIERALDALAYGVILLDAGGQMVWINRAADRILTENDGLGLVQNMLRATAPEATRTLSRLLVGAIARGGGTSALRLDRPSLKEPYVVFAAPLPPARLWSGATQAAAIVMITDPTLNGEEAGALLAMIYGLTPAEVRVALLIGRGLSSPQAAAHLAVSLSTVKTHLRHCFDKTGVRSQVELARLLALMPRSVEPLSDPIHVRPFGPPPDPIG